jgi:acyl-CoA dehydrogenase
VPLSDFGVISLAYGLNHYILDKPYDELLGVFSREKADFSRLGEFAGREVYEATYWIDRFFNPYLASWSILGESRCHSSTSRGEENTRKACPRIWG